MSSPAQASTGSSRTALDPVCGMRVDPATARGGALVHAGTEYAFCSPHCRAAFEAEPARFVAAGEEEKESCCAGAPPRTPVAPGQAAAPGGGPTLYVCPMHPEIERDRPGDCPICGMALEPKVARAGAEDGGEL